MSVVTSAVALDDIFDLRGTRSPVNLRLIIELRWAGETSGVGDPWANDHTHRRQSRAGTPSGEAWLGPVGLGSGVMPALAMAGGQRRVEEPVSVCGFSGDGASRLDRVARLSALYQGKQSQRPQGRKMAQRSDPKSVELTSTAALAISADGRTTATVAPTPGRLSLSGRARLGGSQPEVFGLQPGRTTAGRFGMAIGGGPFGVPGSRAGMDLRTTSAVSGPVGEQRSLLSPALDRGPTLSVGDFG